MIRRSVSPLLSAASPHKKSPKDPFSVVEQSLASTKQFLFELQDSKDDYERAAAAADANTATQHVQASVSPRQPALSPVAERSSSAAAGAEHASEADDYDSDTFIAVDTLRSPPRSARSTKSNHDVMHADVLQAQSVASITQPPSHAAASLSTSAPLASPASAVDDYEDDAWIPCEDAAADVGLVVTIRK